MTDYTSVDAKLARAVEHLERFEIELGAWYKTNPLGVVPKPNPDGIIEDLFLCVRTPLPPSLPALLGDCIHNSRCALDHLVMALAVDNGMRPGNKTTSFPVSPGFASYHGYEAGQPPVRPQRWNGAYQVRKLRDPAQAFIEGLQPYHRKGNSWTLVELKQLDDRDKHRYIFRLDPEITATAIDPPNTTVTYVTPLRLKDGTPFATITFGPDYSGVKMYPPVPVGVMVEHSNGVGWLDVVGFPKAQLIPHVECIVSEAKRLFP